MVAQLLLSAVGSVNEVGGKVAAEFGGVVTELVAEQALAPVSNPAKATDNEAWQFERWRFDPGDAGDSLSEFLVGAVVAAHNIALARAAPFEGEYEATGHVADVYEVVAARGYGPDTATGDVFDHFAEFGGTGHGSEHEGGVGDDDVEAIGGAGHDEAFGVPFGTGVNLVEAEAVEVPVLVLVDGFTVLGDTDGGDAGDINEAFDLGGNKGPQEFACAHDVGDVHLLGALSTNGDFARTVEHGFNALEGLCETGLVFKAGFDPFQVIAAKVIDPAGRSAHAADVITSFEE